MRKYQVINPMSRGDNVTSIMAAISNAGISIRITLRYRNLQSSLKHSSTGLRLIRRKMASVKALHHNADSKTLKHMAGISIIPWGIIAISIVFRLTVVASILNAETIP